MVSWLKKKPIVKLASSAAEQPLPVKLRAANAPIELRNLTEQLRSKVAEREFSDLNKDLILKSLENMLQAGSNGESREWRYLNKEAHEEENRTEFDRQTVH